MSLITLLAGSVLAFVFGWGALAKLVRFPQWQTALAVYRLPAGGATIAAVVVPFLESIVVALLGTGHALAGAALTLGLLAAFSLALLSARREHADRLPCGCFGRTTLHDYRLLVARNAGLAVLAGIVLIDGRDHLMTESLWSAPTTLLPTALVVVGLSLALWVGRELIEGMRRH
jgi:Methylamine utilisation protein MauE